MEKINYEEVPETLFGVQFTEEERKRLANGEFSNKLENLKMENGKIVDCRIKLKKNKAGKIEVEFKIEPQKIVIPKKIFGKELDEEKQIQLAKGEPVEIIPGYKVNIDQKNNVIGVKLDKKIENITEIGGVKLTPEEQKLLQSGKTLESKIFKGKNGYFVAAVSVKQTPEGTQINYHHYKAISKKEAQALLGKQAVVATEKNDLENIISTTKEIKAEKTLAVSVENKKESAQKQTPEKNLDDKAIEHINNGKVLELNKMKEKGYKPSNRVKTHLKETKLEDKVKTGMAVALGLETKEVLEKSKIEVQKSPKKKQPVNQKRQTAKNIIDKAFSDM